MKIKIKELEETGLINCLPEDVFIDVITSDSKTIFIKDLILVEARKELNYRKELGSVLNEIARLNNKGIEFEKSGKIQEAINQYEKCMNVMYKSIENKLRDSFAWHSPNRLRILYKKEKHYREKEFLSEFILFCEKNMIEYPDIFLKQLKKKY